MLKRLLLGAAAVLAVLVLVLAVKAALFTSVQLEPQPTEKIAIDADAAAARLAKATTFKTISHQIPWEFRGSEFTEFHAWLAEAFPQVHAALQREAVNDYSLLYTWKGSEPDLPPVLLLAHMDVVPVDAGSAEGWTHPPFDGVVADGRVWGRGSLDDKCSVIGLLETTEALLKSGWQPRRTLYFCFGHDEEIGGANGAGKIAALLAERGIKAWFSLDEGSAIVEGVLPGIDTPVALIATGEKGYVSLELTVMGEGGHSSQPPPQTSIGILAAGIARLEANQFPAAVAGPLAEMFDVVGREMDMPLRGLLANLWLFRPLLQSQLANSDTTNAALRTTTAVTIMEAGTKENVLPIKARAVVNFRILPGDTVAGVIEHTKRVLADDRITVNLVEGSEPDEPSPVSSTDSDSYRLLAQSVRNVHPDFPVGPGMTLGGTDTKHYYGVAENCYRFQPFVLDSADLATIHGTDESILIERYLDGIQLFAEILRNAAG
ncbi:MAG: M20 family peptidase [Candidatus Hydrogenedens sp.]|nr:M20 family peptidase [Candidatus Hydrogenedens sp.]